jgi:hypothetical protein
MVEPTRERAKRFVAPGAHHDRRAINALSQTYIALVLTKLLWSRYSGSCEARNSTVTVSVLRHGAAHASNQDISFSKSMVPNRHECQGNRVKDFVTKG